MVMPSASVEKLRQLIAQSHNIVFFGGAGMSTESGIPDFRSAHGLYSGSEGKRFEDMLSIRFFLNNPDAFWDFYKTVMLHPDAAPNAGHYALARLEAQGRLTAVITQNIDGLHQRAGSRRVMELHGSVHRNFCMACGRRFALDALLALPGVPHCGCGGLIRPDVVLYGEPLDDEVIDAAIHATMACDLMIVGGTSLTVYPAANLLRYRGQGELALVNREETPFDACANLIVRDSLACALDAAIPAQPDAGR